MQQLKVSRKRLLWLAVLGIDIRRDEQPPLLIQETFRLWTRCQNEPRTGHWMEAGTDTHVQSRWNKLC